MASKAPSQPSSSDFFGLYEHFLLEYEQECRKLAKSKKDGMHDIASHAIVAGSHLVGTLQCASSEAKSPSESELLSSLVDNLRLEIDTSESSSILLTQSVKKLATSYESRDRRTHLPEVPVDVDAFFEAYPHCCSPSKDIDESSEFENSDLEEEEEENRKPKQNVMTLPLQQRPSSSNSIHSDDTGAASRRPGVPRNPYARKSSQLSRPPSAGDNPNSHQANNTVDLTVSDKSSGRGVVSSEGDLWTSGNNNNLTSRSSVGTQPQPQQLGWQKQQRPVRTLSSTTCMSTEQAWEDHHNQNPFQTAREFASVSDSRNVKQRPEMHQNRKPPHQQHYQQNPHQNASTHISQEQRQYDRGPPGQGNYALPPAGYNPYANSQAHRPIQDDEQMPASVDGPMIRQSLKRKFQLPTKRAANNENKKASSGSNGKKSGSGGVTSRPPATNENKDDNEEEDDLPEELKRFGKDLVEKIENEIMDIGDPITFDDIAGLADAKQTVQEVVCWPMKRPDLFTGLRRAPNGLLLYGPPGTGKTLIGKAIAHESGATFFSISSSSLTSKWIGEGEKLVRTLFAVAAFREPAVVFIDEIDSLLTQRKADENEASRRIKTEFLVQLDGTGTSGQGRVLMIGATNRPQELDEAARRRFTKRLYIPLPETEDREILLRALLEKNNHRLGDTDIHKLAVDTKGFSGADLKSLSTDAAMGPIRQLGSKALEVNVCDVPPISYKHFRQALRGTQPSVAPSDLLQYEEFNNIYGSIKRAESSQEDASSDEE